MELDVEDLAGFYGTRMGQAARRAILARLHARWTDVTGLRLLGYGFTAPYLRAFAGQAERVVAVSPARMGIAPWPKTINAATLCDEDALPFADSMFDRILIVHGLEGAEGLRPLLRQVWRVLAPEGRLLVVAPNRASLWAQVEVSPFAEGRPFSRRELERQLREALFEPFTFERALYAPPFAPRFFSARNWERAGRRFFPGIGGVHVVEAGKSLYAPAAPAPAKVKARLAQLSPDY